MDDGSRTLFVGLIGTPYESDLCTTAFRLVEEALAQRHEVTVWACGYATTLTLSTLGDRKPRNVLDWDRRYPSTAAVVDALLAASHGRLEWLICRFCMEERGATEQMEGVRVRPPHEFLERLQAADVSLVMGVK